MELALRDQLVTTQDFNYTVAFKTDGGFEIRIENDYSLHTAEGVLTFSPEPANADCESLTALTEHAISSAKVEKNGVLDLKFANGSRLRVEPSDDYEAWTVAGPGGMKVVCMPGGELATWQVNINQ